jgi:hypothetical protein
MKTGELEIGVVATNLGNEWHEEYWDTRNTGDPYEVRQAYYGYAEFRRK